MISKFDELKKSIDVICERTSKKEAHRIENFKKRHKYDEKTKTVEVKINGKKLKVPFEITNGPANSDDSIIPRDGLRVNDINYYKVRLPRKTLKLKPEIADTVFSHEIGHIAYKLFPQLCIEAEKDICSILGMFSGALSYHGKLVQEYLADIYAARNSGYGIKGFNKMCEQCRATAATLNQVQHDGCINLMEQIKADPSLVDIDETLVKYFNLCNKIEKLSTEIDACYGLFGELKYNNPSIPNNINEEMLQRVLTELINSRDDAILAIRAIRKTARVLRNELKSACLKRSKDFPIENQIELNKLNNELSLRKSIVSRYVNENSVNELKVKIYENFTDGKITIDERDYLLFLLR